MNKVNFQAASSDLLVEDLNKNKKKEKIHDDAAAFTPNDIRNYLFWIRPKHSA